MGRNKYVCPVYQSLEDSGQHDLGVQWFDENQDFYHPVTATAVEEILGITAFKQRHQDLVDAKDSTIKEYLDLNILN